MDGAIAPLRQPLAAARPPRLAFLSAAALLFAASGAWTAASCASMAAMGMRMPGGWTMSMAWMRMAGQTWPGAAASFLAMWTVMMAAMMLPSLVPMLARCREALFTRGEARLGGRTAAVAAGYFLVWAAWGAAIFPLGAALAALEMRSSSLSRVVPAASGLAVALAGALQLTRWKARHLACCRDAPGRALGGSLRAAFSHGLLLGRHCARCCAGWTLALLALGVMDLGAMAAVTAAITAERLAPRGERVARALGAVAIGAGALLAVRALGIGRGAP